jgi:hypothetical protein
MIMRPQKVGLLSLIAAIVGSGCGRQGHTVPASEVLSRIRNTTALASARYSVAASVASETTTGGRFLPVYHGGGIFDFIHGEVSIDLSVVRPRPSDVRFILDVDGYWRSTEEDRRLPAGKKWIRLRPKDVQKIGLDMYWYVRGDPTQELKFLLHQTPRLQDLGSEDVHGVDVDRYRMTVTTGQIDSGLQAGGTDLTHMGKIYFRALIKYLGMRKLVHIDVWVDAGGRVIRAATTVTRKTLFPDDPSIEGPIDVTQRQVFDYFDYDKYWVMPPARQTVADPSELPKR